ncbi:uncharacterized protein LOC116347219 isoform X2 [Contarinia nasturtii]|uniref:uncharacterized protein LOC116347219 isoform X2 n=1 Tax=Contarinia nasturtii TaxID=265458 RepID=UPI0012D3AFBB|nr:uncharacterized protein LOC116347219 isoform X2 [Contarinia nasturtii]
MDSCAVKSIGESKKPSYKEKYRLQVHFSVPSGWMNDPNGLVYAGDYYHLFYQYNPKSTTFGSPHWGHARSKDLIHWENLPIALKPIDLPEGVGDIFSGCCVSDKNNVAGFTPKSMTDTNALIAVYTINSNVSQTQAISYSLDNGITWTAYKNNPVIQNPGVADFRDPNIIERDGKFYMTLAVHDRISFYSSKDLKEWRWLSDFGIKPNEGDKSGVWECPSLFSINDEQGNVHDILIVSENGPSRGSLLQYFIGKFDGNKFNSYDKSKLLWLENGFDNYAAIPYHNDPLKRLIIIGWLSNWLYTQGIPTSTWRGQMTIPRELSLKHINGNLYLAQRPVDELKNIKDSSKSWSLSKNLDIKNNQTFDITSIIPLKIGSVLSLEYVFDIGNVTNGKVGLKFGNSLGEFVTFLYNIEKNEYEFDRRNSGNVSFDIRFADIVPTATRISNDSLLSGQIILDTASIEIFADDGLNTFSALFFPTEPFEHIQVTNGIEDYGKSMTIQKLNVSALNSIWKH